MKETPPPIDWPKNPALAPAPLHPKFKLEEPLHPVQIAAYRRMSAAEKFRILEGMYCFGVELKKVQLRKKHPEWDSERLEREARTAMMYAAD